jgi:iron-sulfur cluster repair protein YtfE (RIC family)
MKIDAETRVRDIALAGRRAAELLDEWHIDYCRQGEETLAGACIAAGIDPRSAIERLRASESEGAQPWSERGIADLVDHVVGTCHREAREAIGEVDRLLTAADLDGDEELLRSAFDSLAREALEQMRREDDRHYAHARALARARDGAGPWPETRHDLHAHASDILARHAATHERARGLRDLAEATLHGRGRADARSLLAAIRALYQLLAWQMTLENHVLLPRALDLEPSRA